MDDDKKYGNQPLKGLDGMAKGLEFQEKVIDGYRSRAAKLLKQLEKAIVETNLNRKELDKLQVEMQRTEDEITKAIAAYRARCRDLGLESRI